MTLGAFFCGESLRICGTIPLPHHFRFDASGTSSALPFHRARVYDRWTGMSSTLCVSHSAISSHKTLVSHLMLKHCQDAPLVMKTANGIVLTQ